MYLSQLQDTPKFHKCSCQKVVAQAKGASQPVQARASETEGRASRRQCWKWSVKWQSRQSSQLAHYPPFVQFPSLSLLPLPSGCTFCNSRVKADMASLPPSTVASRRRARGARFAASPWWRVWRSTSPAARAMCAAPVAAFAVAYTVVVRQSAFQGQQRAFTSLMLPGGICNQPLKTAAATRALAALFACVVVAMAIICRGLSMGRAVQKFRTPAKGPSPPPQPSK